MRLGFGVSLFLVIGAAVTKVVDSCKAVAVSDQHYAVAPHEHMPAEPFQDPCITVGILHD